MSVILFILVWSLPIEPGSDWGQIVSVTTQTFPTLQACESAAAHLGAWTPNVTGRCFEVGS